MKLTILMFLFMSSSAIAGLKLVEMKKDLDIIWGIEFLDKDTLILTERDGSLKKINLKTKKVTDIKGAPEVYNRGQGGLLDITLHPDFKNNKRVYLSYSKQVGEFRTTAVGFGVLEGNELKNFKDIFVGKGQSDKRYHFGSRITFDEKNRLYFSIGDRGQRPNAQDLSNHFGKVMRINDDGSIPEDNPFVGQKDKEAAIWSYGHRNPQGLFYDLEEKKLYEMEHGPRGGDEINLVEKGKNYGWPKQSYGKEYNWFSDVGEKKVAGVEQPIKYYDPSIAPSDLLYYRGERYPEFKDALVAGALKLTHVNVYNPKTKKEERYFDDKDERVRAIAVSPDDYFYLGTDAGKIYRVERTK